MDEKRNPLEDAQSAGIIAATDKGHDITEGSSPQWRIERGLVYVTACVKCGAELVVERGREGTWVYGGPAATQNCPAQREGF